MDSIFEKCETHLPNIEPDDLSTEDCRFLLRALEKRAFEFVVCALRAQGPLSQYKEIILDHLKSLFFISDEDFCLRMRLSANDPVLSKIAQELNPSYDNTSEWLAASYSLVAIEFPKMLQLHSPPNKHASRCAQQMLEQMNGFNSLLANEKEAYQQLMQVHRHVYVPEKLRRLLHDSEKDVHGRVDVLREKKAPPSSSKIPGVVRHVGRPRKSELPQYASAKEELEDSKKIKKVIKLMEDLKSKNKVQNDSCANQPSSQPDSPTNGCQVKPAISNPKEALKIQNEFSIHYTGGANVVVIDPEDQGTGKETKVRKRKSKQDDVTCVCARVLPFVFECPPGQMKPPRGNPDKRTTKRSVHGFSNSYSGDAHAGVGYVGGSMHQSHHSNHLSNNYYGHAKPRMQLSSNNQYIPGPESLLLPAAAKRARAASLGEKDKSMLPALGSQQQHKQQVLTSFRPSIPTIRPGVQQLPAVTTPSTYYSSNLKTNGAMASTATFLKSSRIMTATQALPSTPLKDNQKEVSASPANFPPTAVDNRLDHQQPEASGLDVLASVSLLDAIATQTPGPSIAPCTENPNEVGSGQVVHSECMPSGENVQMASTSRIPTTLCIPPRPLGQTAGLPPVSQTAQNFLKKHALENGQIDEATTLGSILADPALRNRLFMSSKAGSTASAGFKGVRQPNELVRLSKEVSQTSNEAGDNSTQ